MPCPTADQLRFELYAVCQQIPMPEYPLSAEVQAEIAAQRERQEYITALDALKTHLKECEICSSPHLLTS